MDSSIGETNDYRHKIVSARTNDHVAESAVEMLDLTCTLGSYVASANSGNVIIKFAEPKIGSLRVSDQACDPTYCTRWNLTMGKFVKVDSKYKSHWYREDDSYDLKDHLLRYADTIARNAPPADVAQPIGEKESDASYWAHQARMAKEQGEG